MATWFSADLHFGHANIIGYSARPFNDVEEMNAGLIERWNSTVAPNDEVWVLGDVAMGKIAETLPRVRELNGRKHLVSGNHDRCWHGNGQHAADWVERYYDAGFDTIEHDIIRLHLNGHRVLACHFPYHGDSHDEERFIVHRPRDTGEWLLHGHVHDRWRQCGRMINVGVDGWGGRPVSQEELIELIDGGPSMQAPLPWPNVAN